MTKPMKRHLFSVTTRDLNGFLEACEGERFYRELHDEKREARRQERLCALVERKLDAIALEVKVRKG